MRIPTFSSGCSGGAFVLARRGCGSRGMRLVYFGQAHMYAVFVSGWDDGSSESGREAGRVCVSVFLVSYNWLLYIKWDA